jgi:hypothetical protein
MSLRSAFAAALFSLAMAVAGSTVALAQGGTIVVDPRTGAFYEQRGPAPAPGYGGRQTYAPPPSRGPSGYYPGKLIQPAPQPQPGFSLRRLFGADDDQARPESAPRVAPRPRPERRRPPPAAVAARPEKPKINPSTHIVVFGDGLADLVGQGLDDDFSDTPEIAVVRKGRSEGGLARSDVAEWPNQIQDILKDGQKITIAVMMLGANDRQPIKEGEVSHEFLSDRWTALYRQRVDAVVRVFKDRNIPVVWVGLPPMRNDKLSADLIAMNEIYRESVERAGGTYVDIWPGFVNEENRYTVTGPDVNGQPSRLRTSDGVLFTQAGARKAAHFADTEIKRILQALRTGTAITNVPQAAPQTGEAPSDGAPTIEQLINASVAPLPEPSGTPPLQPKPIAGPVLPLTRPDLSPGGTLISGRPKMDSDSTYMLQKALREGVTPGPRPGRADDDRWPPRS